MAKEHGLEVLDLHGTYHADVSNAVESFVFKHFSNMPVKIICGNSTRMTAIVFGILMDLELSFERGVGNTYNTFTVNGDRYE